MVHVEGYDRLDPVTGRVEHVKPHEDARRKATPVVPTDQGKGVTKEVTPALHINRKAEQGSSNEQPVPIDNSFTRADTKGMLHSIQKANLEDLVSNEPMVISSAIKHRNSYKMIEAYAKRLGEDQEVLMNTYDTTKDWLAKALYSNKYPDGSEISSFANKQSVAASYSKLRAELSKYADYENLTKLKTEDNIYVIGNVNHRLTDEFLKSSDDSGLKQAVTNVKDLVDFIDTKTPDIRKETASIMEKYGMKDYGAEALDFTANGDPSFNQAVMQTMYHKDYNPITKPQPIVKPKPGSKEKAEPEPVDLGEFSTKYVHVSSAANRAYLNAQGVKEMTLYRTLDLNKNHPTYKKLDKAHNETAATKGAVQYTAEADISPASLWSSVPPKADKGSVVVASTIPVHDIVSSKYTDEALNKDNAFIIASPLQRKVSLHK